MLVSISVIQLTSAQNKKNNTGLAQAAPLKMEMLNSIVPCSITSFDTGTGVSFGLTIAWERQTGVTLDSFIVHRCYGNGTFERLASLSAAAGTHNEYTDFMMTMIDTSTAKYIIQTKSGSTVSTLSCPTSVVFCKLKSAVDAGSSINLSFDPYLGGQSVSSYKVTRYNPATFIYDTLGTVTPLATTMTFQDNSPPASGNIYYRIEVGLSGSCDPDRANIKTSRSNIKTCARTSSMEKLSLNNLKLYPNPAGNNITVECDNLKGAVQITLFNSLGQQVLKQEFQQTGKQLFLDVSKLPEGYYLVKLEDSNQQKITSHIAVIK